MKAMDSYGEFNGVVNNEGADVGGIYNPPHVTLDSCKLMCDANLACNSFAYDPGYHCALKDLCLKGTESTWWNGGYRTYYRLECRGLSSPEPTHTNTSQPSIQATNFTDQNPYDLNGY